LKWPAGSVTPSFVRAAEGRLRCGSDPDLYHQGGTSSEAAAELCRGCGFVASCLAYAVENRELSGVWGGTTEGERRRLRARASSADAA
jgi:WhiB family transcriptional regulator, redox-sensing transcriptional regulator